MCINNNKHFNWTMTIKSEYECFNKKAFRVLRVPTMNIDVYNVECSIQSNAKRPTEFVC